MLKCYPFHGFNILKLLRNLHVIFKMVFNGISKNLQIKQWN